jgi:hypothetical protein
MDDLTGRGRPQQEAWEPPPPPPETEEPHIIPGPQQAPHFGGQPYHPLCERYPRMEGLCASITANGLRKPITLYQGQILDGKERYRACLKVGAATHFETFVGTEAEARDFLIDMNVRRRHLNDFQKGEMALGMITVQRGGDRRSASAKPNTAVAVFDPAVTEAEAAKLCDTSEDTIQRVRRVLEEKDRPYLAEGARRSIISVSFANDLAKDSDKADEAAEWLSRAIIAKGATPEQRQRWAAAAKRTKSQRKEVNPMRQSKLIAVARAASEEEKEFIWKALWEMFSPPKRDRLLKELTEPANGGGQSHAYEGQWPTTTATPPARPGQDAPGRCASGDPRS